MSLTPQQQKFLEFIKHFIQKRGYAPSQQEIAKHFGYRSLGTVQDYLKRLQQSGHLQKTWNGKRTIQLTGTAYHHEQEPINSHLNIPLMGRVAAGSPIEAVLNEESVDVPFNMVRKPGRYFALEVRGQSMIDDGIHDHDYVIIRKQKSAQNGDTVVALVDREATIKRFYQHPERIELKPANANYQSIFVDQDADFSIEGIFVGLIRYAN